VPNCAYQLTELYLSVEGQNSVATENIRFDLLLAGTLSVGGICESFEWEQTAWRPCDVECGKGTQRRAVWCQTKSGLAVDARLCN